MVKKGDLYFYSLLAILFLILIAAVKYFVSYPLLSPPADCYDDCNSLNYECGEWRICGELRDCGGCPMGLGCKEGKCADLEFGLEKKLGDNLFWFLTFIVVIPVVIIIIILIRVWISSRKYKEKGEVVRWGLFKKAVVDKADEKGLESLK